MLSVFIEVILVISFAILLWQYLKLETRINFLEGLERNDRKSITDLRTWLDEIEKDLQSMIEAERGGEKV